MPETGHVLAFTSRFCRSLKRYAGNDRHRQECVAQTLSRMANNVSDPRLHTHGLTGSLKGCFASSCGYDCRIVFRFSTNPQTATEEIVLLEVGTHDSVY